MGGLRLSKRTMYGTKSRAWWLGQRNGRAVVAPVITPASYQQFFKGVRRDEKASPYADDRDLPLSRGLVGGTAAYAEYLS